MGLGVGVGNVRLSRGGMCTDGLGSRGREGGGAMGCGTLKAGLAFSHPSGEPVWPSGKALGW